jgi:hypothetical protein
LKKNKEKNDLGARIIEVAEAPADQLLVAFFNTGGPFAGSTFDDLPDNPRNEFSASDLLAASLLDVRFEPRAVRALLDARSGALTEHLRGAVMLLAMLTCVNAGH